MKRTVYFIIVSCVACMLMCGCSMSKKVDGIPVRYEKRDMPIDIKKSEIDVEKEGIDKDMAIKITDMVLEKTYGKSKYEKMKAEHKEIIVDEYLDGFIVARSIYPPDKKILGWDLGVTIGKDGTIYRIGPY